MIPLQGKTHIGIVLLLLLPLTSSAQDKLVQAAEKASIVIDSQIGSKGEFLSMQQEMDLYMRLKSEDEVTIFHPNPSGGKLWLEHNLEGEVKVELLNKGGKRIFLAEKMQVHQLDLRGYPPGLYTLIVHYSGGKKKQTLTIR